MACITLLSDLGLLDASVGSIKGILLQQVPKLPVIDIAHDVLPYHLQQAAYLTCASYSYFPAGSFHIILCDVFYNAAPAILLFKKDGHYFIAPDNGVLPLAFHSGYDGAWQLPIDYSASLKDVMRSIASFVAVAATDTGKALARLKPAVIGTTLNHWQPKLSGNSVDCHIIHIDRFENVILNITKAQFDEFRNERNFRIEVFMDSVTEISNHYADVKKGELLCRFNSAGYMEISINKDKAASLLGLKLNKEQHLVYRAIKIAFE